jgi:diguanylate cyclase (GGDEF)-like protein/PAS domain S-box-containing protein
MLTDFTTERRGEHRFTRLFDAAPLAMVLTRLADEVLLHANPAAAALSGYLAEELVGRTSQALHAWVDTALRAKYFAELRAGRPVRAQHAALRRKDGGELALEVYGEPLSLDGEPCALSMFVDVTPQIDYLRQIERQHQLLAAVFEAIGDALILTDSQHRIMLANRATEQVFGCAPDALLGHSADALFADADAPGEVSSGTVPDLPEGVGVVRGRRDDGSEFPAEVSISPVRSADAAPPGRAILVRDISERERRRRTLAEHQARLQDIIDSMADWVWEVDGEARYTFASERVRDVLGYAPDELIGKSVFELMSPDDSERIRAEFTAVAAAGESFRDLENTCLAKSGETRIMATSGAPIRDTAGAIVGWRGTDRDITETRRAAERVRDSEAQLRAIFDHANVGIMLLTGYRIITRANRRLAEILGYDDPARLEGASVRVMHLSDAHFAEFGERHYETLRRREQMHVEYQLRRQDGSAVWCLVSGSALDAAQPADLSLGVIWTVEDISAMKESEQRYRGMFESAGQPMFTLDADGRITAANRAGCEVLRCTDGRNLLGRTLPELSPPTQPDGLPSAAKAADLIRRALSGERVRYGWEHLRRDGSALPVEVTLTRTLWGGAPSLLVTWYDLSDRHRAAELERRATAVFENTAEGIMLTDADDRIVAVNPAFTAITGYSAEEAVGETPRLLQSGRQSREFYQAMRRELSATGSWQGEIWNRRKDGEIYPEWLSISEIRDADGTSRQRIGVFSDITRMRRTEEELEQLTHYDPVTGLPNATLLRIQLTQAVQSAEAQGRPLALLLLNLDGFKRVVASFGHEVADGVLAAVADRLRTQSRSNQSLSRLVGDTFSAVLELPRAELSPSRHAVLMQDALRAELPVPGAPPLTLSGCVGIAMFPGDAATAPELLRNADAALQRAKAEGPGSIAFYRPDLTATALRRIELERTLRTALAAAQFELHYQPKLDLACRCIVGAEALLRWRRPDGVLVPPGEFLPVLEGTELMLDLDRWVLRAAAEDLLAWEGNGLPRVRVSVNVSAAMLLGGNLAAEIEALVAETGLDPTLIEIEVLENILIEEPEHAEAELAALSALGIGVALDDFGTGYASLGYLKRFAFDYLKIDRGFIAGLTPRSEDMAIVRATITMAHSLGILVVAEGVERDEQMRQLAALGCDLLQGYHIGRPMSAGDFAGVLAADARPLDQRLRLTLKPRVLLVGDDPAQLPDIAARLGDLGWAVLRAPGATATRAILAHEAPNLVLCDQHLADGDAVDLLAGLRSEHPAVTRVLLSSDSDPSRLIEAINRGGVYRCLVKPCSAEDLAETMQAGYEHGLRILRVG